MSSPMLETGGPSVWAHVLAFFAWFGSLVGLLPAFAALIGIIWYTIQIMESNTVQKWLDKKRTARKGRRIAKLKAEQKVLTAELEALEVVREARVFAEDKVAKATHEATTQLATEQAAQKQAALDDGKSVDRD